VLLRQLSAVCRRGTSSTPEGTTEARAPRVINTVVGDGFREAGDGRRGLWRVATAKGDGGDFPRRAAHARVPHAYTRVPYAHTRGKHTHTRM
jgi:hypothetical protein